MCAQQLCFALSYNIKYSLMLKSAPAYLFILALPMSAFAEESNTTPSVIPSAYLDFAAYGDDANGMGGEYLQNANGIFNVHHDDATGAHSHGGGQERGLKVRGIELTHKSDIPGWPNVTCRMTTDMNDREIEEA